MPLAAANVLSVMVSVSPSAAGVATKAATGFLLGGGGREPSSLLLLQAASSRVLTRKAGFSAKKNLAWLFGCLAVWLFGCLAVWGEVCHGHVLVCVVGKCWWFITGLAGDFQE